MLCAFFIVILAYGYSLSVEHQTTMQRHYAKSADELWDVIVDYRKYSQWRENVYEVNELPAKLTAIKIILSMFLCFFWTLFSLQLPISQF